MLTGMGDRAIVVLAQLSRQDMIKALGTRGGSSRSAMVTAVVILAIAGLLLVAWRTVRHFLRILTQPETPHDLFWTLARQHGLTSREERALKSAAGRLGLSDPTALFVHKGLLERQLQAHRDPVLESVARKIY